MADINPLAQRYMGDAQVLPVEPLSDDSYDAIKDATVTLEKAYMRLCKPSAIPPETLSELKVTYLAQLLRLETIIMTEQRRHRAAIDKIWDKAVPESAKGPGQDVEFPTPNFEDENEKTSETESPEQDTQGERDIVDDEEESPDDVENYSGVSLSGAGYEF